MKLNNNLLIVTAVIIVLAAVAWFSSSIQGSQKTYELQPQVAIPPYKTDITRVVDAYERLMDRYMDLTERNLNMIDSDLKAAVKTLNLINSRMSELSARTARIERALGIEQAQKADKPEAKILPAPK